MLASSLEPEGSPTPIAIVERTAGRLRKAKPNAPAGLVSVEGAGLIKCELAPTSIDRFELALNRIAAAAAALRIELVNSEKGASFLCDGETIGFSVSELVKRVKHIPTEKELADREAWQRKQAKRWQLQGSWDDISVGFSGPQIPDWDHHPTGQLAFEFEQFYFMGGSPRRLFRDAKIQRLETMAGEIAVGAAVLAAAKKADRLRREEDARLQEQHRIRRERAMRDKHVEERRGAALDKVLDEIAALDRLRLLVDTLRTEVSATENERVAAFVGFAEARLRARTVALSADGLGSRFTELRLFGPDDDHDFRPAYRY